MQASGEDPPCVIGCLCDNCIGAPFDGEEEEGFYEEEDEFYEDDEFEPVAGPYGFDAQQAPATLATFSAPAGPEADQQQFSARGQDQQGPMDLQDFDLEPFASLLVPNNDTWNPVLWLAAARRLGYRHLSATDRGPWKLPGSRQVCVSSY